MNKTMPFIAQYWQQTAQNRALRAVLLITAGVCLLTVSAKFKVPYYPVPMTLQTLVVLLLPFMLGGAQAVSCIVAYLLLGASGAPVFAAGGGIAYLTGPTAGFLLGFLPAAAFAAFWHKRGMLQRFSTALACMVVADGLIFVCGVAWLAVVVGSADKALTLGFYPFIIGDLSKALLAAALVVVLSNIQRKNTAV